MKKIHRLHKQKDFLLLFRRGRKVESPLFKVFFKPNHLSWGRLALIVPRGVSKKAVLRNTLKRRAREWVRKEGKLATRPLDVALAFKKEAASVPKEIFYEELAKALGKISY